MDRVYIKDYLSANGCSRDNYRHLFEASVTGMYETTLGGRYVAANPMLAQMFGYEYAAELIEHTVNLNEGFYVERQRRAEFIEQIREHEVVRGFESQVYRRDGSRTWISEHALAIKNAAGDLLGFQGTTLAVTERKVAETSRPRPDGPSSPPFISCHPQPESTTGESLPNLYVPLIQSLHCPAIFCPHPLD